jgi:hypothetical protein
MRQIKKKKMEKESLIDIMYRSNPEAAERLNLVNRFPLKEPLLIVTKISDWQIIIKRPASNKGAASFVM